MSDQHAPRPAVGRPTSRRRTTTWACAVLVGLAAAVLVTGCADGSRPTADPMARPMGPENPSRPPSPQAWLDQVCTALRPAVETAAPVPALDPADPRGSRDRWIAYLEDRARALDAAADGINAAGPAPGDGGQQVTGPVVTLLRDQARTARDGLEDLRAVPDVSTGTLINTVQEVSRRFPLAGPATSLRDIALTPDLARVAPEVASCREAFPPA